jgi:hypothetical protein
MTREQTSAQARGGHKTPPTSAITAGHNIGAMPTRRPPHPEEAAMNGNGQADTAGDGIAFLDLLAAQMHARGWSAYITTPAGRLASLFVQHPHDHPECGDIIAALDAATGYWWYWFSWAERIAPAHAPAAAADAIIRALQRPTDEPPEPPPAASSQTAEPALRGPMIISSRALPNWQICARLPSQAQAPKGAPSRQGGCG